MNGIQLPFLIPCFPADFVLRTKVLFHLNVKDEVIGALLGH